MQNSPDLAMQCLCLVATYCTSRMVEHPKSMSTQPIYQPDVSPCRLFHVLFERGLDLTTHRFRSARSTWCGGRRRPRPSRASARRTPGSSGTPRSSPPPGAQQGSANLAGDSKLSWIQEEQCQLRVERFTLEICKSSESKIRINANLF